MALMNSDAKLFGLDLRELTSELRAACQQLLGLPLLRRIWPATVVRVVGNVPAPVGARALGTHIDWVELPADALEKTQHVAVLLDSEQVLQRVLTLPPMAPSALRNAVELDVQIMTPFAAADTLWAYAQQSSRQPQGRQRIEVVIASRSHVQQALSVQASRLVDVGNPEVWAPASTVSVVLPGFGESIRYQSEARRRNWILLGLAAVSLLVVALAVTPTMQLRMRAMDASQQFASLTKSSSEAMAQRQALVQGGQDLGKLQERLQQQVDHLRVLAVLSKVFPDDAAAQRVVFRSGKLTVQGLTSNASNVVALLAKTPGFVDVRLPTAVTRVPGSGKENFVLEATIDTKLLGLLAKDEEAQPSPEVDADTTDSKESP